MKNSGNISKQFTHLLVLLSTLGLLTHCGQDAGKESAVKNQLFNSKPEDLTNTCNILTSTNPDAKDAANPKLIPLSKDVAEITKLGIKPEPLTIVNTLFYFEEKLASFKEDISAITLLKDVSPLPYVRQAAAECDSKLNDFYTGLYSNEIFYKQLLAVKKKYSPTEQYLHPEASRLLELTLERFRLNGVELKIAEKQDEYEEFLDLKKRLNQLEANFKASLNNSTSTVTLGKEDILGLNEPIKEHLKEIKEKDVSSYQLTLDEPSYRQFMRTTKNAEARKKAQKVFDKRGGKQNIARLEEATKIRARIAQLLGYASYADLVHTHAVGKKSEQTAEFLQQLEEKLEPQGEKEIQALLEAKKQELKEESDGQIHPWDYAYYTNMVLKNQYSIDSEALRASFPQQTVITGAMDIAETLLGVKISLDPTYQVWNEEVQAYKVEVGGQLFGHITLDLFPRESKSKGSKTITLINSRLLSDRTTFRTPSVVIVANLSKAHWTHDDVVGFLHGFGEALHVTLNRVRYPSLSSPSVNKDFAEVPALIAENWAWQKETLKKLSVNLSEESLEKIVESRQLNLALEHLKLISQSFAELNLHSKKWEERGFADARATFQERMKKPLLVFQEDTYPEASFEHTMNGYSLGIYSHLAAEVYAADLFTRFEGKNVLDAEVGKSYREWVLEKGDNLETDQIVQGFLGRPISQDAFLKSLGL